MRAPNWFVPLFRLSLRFLLLSMIMWAMMTFGKNS